MGQPVEQRRGHLWIDEALAHSAKTRLVVMIALTIDVIALAHSVKLLTENDCDKNPRCVAAGRRSRSPQVIRERSDRHAVATTERRLFDTRFPQPPGTTTVDSFRKPITLTVV